MTSYNISPISPAPLPFQYVGNYGEAYDFYGLSGQGCVDTVYSTTSATNPSYNSLNHTGPSSFPYIYTKGVVVPATTALHLVQEANAQLGPYFQACTSLSSQAAISSGASTTVASASPWYDLLPQLHMGWIVDDAVLAVFLVIVIVAGKMVWEKFADK